MKYRSQTIIVGAIISVGLVVAGAGFGLAADSTAKKAKKKRVPGAHATQVKVTDGTDHAKAGRGTAWVIYDDASREAWGGDYGQNGGAAGNKFTSTWGTFYCDMMSAFVKWTGTGTNLFYSMWTGTANTGADLAGNTYTTISGVPTSGTTWILVNGSTSPVGFIGNTNSTFSNTAWLGVYISSPTTTGLRGPDSRLALPNDVGIDTNGGGSHGFYVDQYTGTGYHESAWNAMVRARFNGNAVPVELTGFTAE